MLGMRPLYFFLTAFLIFAPPAFAETGLASWYGWREHGHLMACGKPFHALGANAASRTYPIGTKLHVTNLANGKHVDVVIMDRGPYVPSRVLDVSLGTARILGFERQGVARVRIEPVTPVVHPRSTKHHRYAAK